ncbi:MULTISPECIES: tyrosine-type recombinase/integrase [unclassified Bifidobacterium]|uniref:tyrosine-type recombinase/integrase n=1 Tax=unclassified Bifidobacterium TaxID=2608897 RepID=UPI0011273B50|nr:MULTISPECIES: tyrosine-type recombinase/integrase [unclassified Bifidobacterium]TPF84356.1 hypothetical protein BW07_05160 [Bifidobacterium sp. UTCIF-36]TPF91027.1 hypothetical protein BW10_02075 [Bifidobacterium sp. UTBIF-56]
MVSYEKYALKDKTTRWRVWWRDPEGRNRNKSGFARKHDAEVWASQNITLAKATGTYVDPSGSRSTVGALGRQWLDGRRNLVKPSTYHPEESAWRLHVEPRWGKVPLRGLTKSSVQEWVNGLAKEYSPTLVIRCHSILTAIIDMAVADRLLTVSPIQNVTLPRKTPRRHIYLTPSQLKALARASGERSTLILTLGLLGLRWGEVSGLRVRDLDVTAKRLHVVENNVKAGRERVIVTPKSNRFRDLAIPECLIGPLRERVEGKQPLDRLFCEPDGAPLRYQGPSVRGWYRTALKAVAAEGVPQSLRCHDLRHTAASLMVASGANVKAVQRMLGHASAAMTLDVYADLFDDDLDAVAERIDAVMGGV